MHPRRTITRTAKKREQWERETTRYHFSSKADADRSVQYTSTRVRGLSFLGTIQRRHCWSKTKVGARTTTRVKVGRGTRYYRW